MVKNTDLKFLGVPRQELECMSDDHALEFATKNPKVGSFLKGWKVVDVKLHAERGCDGYMRIITQKIIRKFDKTVRYHPINHMFVIEYPCNYFSTLTCLQS
ncbi:uncharacterized protein LOC117167107 [Belonocnema kinseyi]|uniref:uncharacterized protein LOC117167107 n=1 Tax=Belonocnema kinseyi TaxID=2817044 RepID=UPI00143DCE6E|nr:uncharacterized protein LOC117167107 [Belonocnema kinseyi]